MLLSNTNLPRLAFTTVLFFFIFIAGAQQVTGVWKGKINKKNVEVKIVQNGDSLTGTSYYYESASNYRRYSIKGYFDPNNNSVVWWDDQLIENKGSNPGKNALLSVADFNCPGGGEMYLDGKSAPKEDHENPKGGVNLTKTSGPSFPDEWDFVIDNYTVGANDPYIIDSVQLISKTPVHTSEVALQPKKIIPEVIAKTTVQKQEIPVKEKVVEVKVEPKPLTIEEKFTSREKLFTKEIPIEGDSIELRFYDNAEID